MKLLTQINRFYFISLLIFFLIAGSIMFFFLRSYLAGEVDEQLYGQKQQVQEQIKTMSEQELQVLASFDILTIVKNAEIKAEDKLFDTILYNSAEDEKEPYRILEFTASAQNGNYRIQLKKSEIENEDIVSSIFTGLLILYGLCVCVLFLVNRYYSKKIFAPFFRTVSQLENYSVAGNTNPPEFPSEKIYEFDLLNRSLQHMTEKIRSDYNNLKTFTENASHELQTPLAVVRSKLELMLQSPQLDEHNSTLLNQALENTIRLSRINQSLLLLAKIDNDQFTAKEEIFLFPLIKHYLYLFEEIISEKEIKVDVLSFDDFAVFSDPALADVLISNLLSNAVRHNIRKGAIDIEVTSSVIVIRNTGPAPEAKPETYFERFRKGNNSASHLGLGLTLVKQITAKMNVVVAYTYENGYHILSLQKHEL